MKFTQKALFAGISLLVGMGFISAEIATYEADRPIAIVKRFKPEVKLQNIDKELLLDPNENRGEQLFSGDSLITGEQGLALVVFMDKSIAKVKPSSMLIINGEVGTADKAMNTRINLNEGEIFLEVEPQGANDFEVSTNRSLASVKGTDFGNRADGYVWVENGQVDVTALNSGQTVSLFEKMYAQVDEEGNDIDSGTLSDDELEDLDQGYEDIDEDLVKKEIILRFRDENGQIREITIDAYEEGQN